MRSNIATLLKDSAGVVHSLKIHKNKVKSLICGFEKIPQKKIIPDVRLTLMGVTLRLVSWTLLLYKGRLGKGRKTRRFFGTASVPI